MKIAFTRHALRQMKKLAGVVQTRITRKLHWYAQQKNPLSFAKRMNQGKDPPLYRFRIGDYRIIFTVKNGKATVLLVIAVKHRRKARGGKPPRFTLSASL